MSEQLKTQIKAAAQHAHQSYVDTVSGCSAHHSGNDHARISATILEKSFTIFLSVRTTPAFGGAAKPRNSGERFLNFDTRSAARATSKANRRSRSASPTTASYAPRIKSLLLQTRN